MRRTAALMSLAFLFASACTKASNPAVAPSPSVAPTSAPSATAANTATAPPGAEPSRVVFHAYGISLNAAGEPGSDRMQILVDAAGPLSVTLHGTNASIRVCRIGALGASPPLSDCATPASASPLQVSSAGVEVRETSGSHYIDEVAVTYTPHTRVVNVRSENINPKPGQSVCKDNGCNPFYELTPHRPGTVKAVANWDGIATGKLLIEVGGVAEHDYSARGQPYAVPAQSQGSSDQGPPNLHVSATRNSSKEVAVALENEGARPLRTPTLEITWP
jgi:hypothetical protein